LTTVPPPIGETGPCNPDAGTSFTTLADADLLALWSSVMQELRQRGVIRSSNNPIGDYGERLVADRLGLTLNTNSTAAYDAVAPDGTRYQIKSRRLLTPRASRQLGAVRNLEKDGFDHLIVVLLGPTFQLLELWRLPIDLVREHAVFRAHVNAHILQAQGAVLRDRRAARLA